MGAQFRASYKNTKLDTCFANQHVDEAVAAKMTLSTQNVLYAIFFSCDGIAIQTPRL